jgi:hypothetical protein
VEKSRDQDEEAENTHLLTEYDFWHVPNRTVKLSSRGGWVSYEVQNRYMPPAVCRSALILIMAPVGWAGACPKGMRAQGRASAPGGIFRKGAPSNHDAGSGAHAQRKETVMRFYQQSLDEQPLRFYCGVDLHARDRVSREGMSPSF